MENGEELNWIVVNPQHRNEDWILNFPYLDDDRLFGVAITVSNPFMIINRAIEICTKLCLAISNETLE